MARKHNLKTWPEYFEDVLHGVKKFEIRRDDRGFRVGDILELVEYLPEPDEFTGRHLHAEVIYRTDFEQKAGYVVLGIRLEAYFDK